MSFPEPHHDHSHCTADLIARAERTCARRGSKLTGQRRDVLACVARSHSAVGAYDVIERMAEQLKEIVAILRRPKNVTQRLVEIHRLENEGDDIYHAAIAELFHDSHDALFVLKWKEVYEKLEAAVDRCENVANIIESVIIKHT